MGSLTNRLEHNVLYGAGGPHLARIAGYPDAEGQRMKDAFYARWPCILILIEKIQQSLKRNKWLVGIAGRRIKCREPRTSLNALMQHSAAEVFKEWMVRSWDLSKEQDFKVAQVIA